MALRLGQMSLAIFGMWLVLTRGVVRHPGWGGGGEVAPHWTVTTAPLAGGLVCIATALAMIWARDKP